MSTTGDAPTPSYGEQPHPQGQGQPYPPQGYTQQYPPPGHPQQYGYGGPVAQPGSSQPPGTMGRRLVARILDGLVLGVPLSVVAGLLGVWVAASSSSSADGSPAVAPLVLLALVGYVLFPIASILYEVLMTARGATLGKRWMGLRVVRFDTGADPGFGSAALRWLIPFVGGFVVIGSLLVYLSPLWDASGLRRGWHDMVATTRVVDVR